MEEMGRVFLDFLKGCLVASVCLAVFAFGLWFWLWAVPYAI